MFKKTAIAAAAIATAIAAVPVSTASATSFYFGFGGPGYGYGYNPYPYPYPYPQPLPQPQAFSCWQAKNSLQAQFAQVWTVECNGSTYTFHVKNWGPVKTVKFNKWNGNYWFV